MTSNFRSVTGALEYSLDQLLSLKKSMLDYGGKRQKTAMAIGGVIVTLVSSLLSISQDVIGESVKSENPNAIQDLREIKQRFNQFIDAMIGDEWP